MKRDELSSLFSIKDWSLYWKRNTGTRERRGQKAGTVDKNGYVRVGVRGKKVFEHRIIWQMVKGYNPEGDIDHIDRNTANNNISNLREVSKQCNSRNSSLYSNNKTGVNGVCFRFKYSSRIKINGAQHRVYYGDSFEEAVFHRLAAEQCVNWAGCDSSSSAFVEANKILGIVL